MSQPSEPPAPKPRLLSLDAFRGLTVAGMILVNNPGGRPSYGPLNHAEWHGFTPTDLVFPSFLFIAGVAIPLALGKRLEQGDAPGSLVPRVVRRALVIVALGLFLSAFPFYGKDLSTLRFPGVLQRIGLCYLAAALVYLFTSVRGQVLTVIGLLVGYWAAMTYIPVPGVGPGDLSRPNNLAAWLDRLILSGHLYKSDYDPEGLLSTLPAVATTLIGVLTGEWLKGTTRSVVENVAGVFAAGVVLFVAGWAWGLAFPINKPLWTSSYVLFCAGLSMSIFGLCAWLMEVQGVKRWAWPFLAFGSNPIVAFVLSGLLARVLTLINVAGPNGRTTTLRALIYSQGFAAHFEPHLASLLYALAYVLFWLVIVGVMYRFKLFVRV